MRVALLPKIPDNSIKFSSSKKGESNDAQYKNPINSKFEYLSTILSTVGAGIAFAFYALIDTSDGFLDNVGNLAKKSEKKLLPNAHPTLRFVAVLLGSVSIISAVYCAIKLPKNLYNTKVETYKKQKEMDVYVRTNSTEKKLTEQIDNEAQNADSIKKQDLTTDYLKLKSAKNNVPYFIDAKTLNQIQRMQSKK